MAHRHRPSALPVLSLALGLADLVGRASVDTRARYVGWPPTEHFENKNDNWCILTLFETLYFGTAENVINKDGK